MSMTGNVYVGTDDLGALVPTREIARIGFDDAILQAAHNLFTGFDAMHVDVQIAHGSELTTIGYARYSTETEEWSLSFIADDWTMGFTLDESDSYSGGTVTYSADDIEYDGDEYDGDEYDARDAYYEQETYAPGDRWGAWLDDTRLPYDPPHKSHEPGTETRADWLAALALDSTECRSFDEWIEAMARVECEECLDYDEDYAERMAERRAGC